MTVPLRVLIVEDSKDDAELICLELERAGFDVQMRRLDTEPAYVEALDESWDLIVSDFHMPYFDGLRAFALYKGRGLDTPFIFVSGALGEDRAVEAMRAGARDYLLKGSLTRLHAAVKRELGEAANRAAQRRAERVARREQRRLAVAVEASGAGVFEHAVPVDLDTYLSPRCCEILGIQPDEPPSVDAVARWFLGRVHDDDREDVRQAYAAFIDGRTDRFSHEFRVSHPERSWVDVAAFANAAARDDTGRATDVVGVILDLTERRRLEAQLRQAQKMDAVGRLAGGVAHDFNNLLTAILSFGEFVLEELRVGDPAFQDMQEVIAAGRRAQRLTSQLLAFSRRTIVAPKIVNVGSVVADMDRMLRRLVGEDIDVATKIAPHLWNVRIDPGALEQVVVNLAVNARDAIQGGGKLTLETANVHLGETYGPAHGAHIATGEHVLIAVSDDGVGMDEATQRQIFEPFFTTKGPGAGTGLGLSTCYGIIKQAGGFIWVYSEVGRGTTFKIYLPRVSGEADVVQRRPDLEDLRGSETILVAEDDEQVRRLAARALRRLGYKVVEAGNGGQALLACERSIRTIDLLLTDIVMPEMSGRELADRLLVLRPAMRVLYISGYTENAIAHRGVLEEGSVLLSKPFTPDELGRAVRRILDG